MVLWQTIRGSVIAALLVGFVPAGSSAVTTGGGDEAIPSKGGDDPGDKNPGDKPVTPQESAYPGRGFIVHEWGTDTIVVGSDGSLQRGLHHEEEDLPSFVYDRIKAGRELGESSLSVEIKMETPVTYFYSDKPLTVAASVNFPKGVFTQWSPAVSAFLPAIAATGSLRPPSPSLPTAPADYADPVLDVNFSFLTTTCTQHYTTIAG